MTMNGIESVGDDVADILATTDENGETAAPDDMDVDTAGPTDDEDDTASAELAAEEADTADIKALRRRGRHSVSVEELRAIQARSRARGVAVGKKRAQQTAKKPKMPPNMVPLDNATRTLVKKWSGKNELFIVRQEGHYYSTCEILCEVVGSTKGQCCVYIPKGEHRFFDRVVGDKMAFMKDHTAEVTTNWTNLQRPSKTTYNEQDFLIRSISMQEAGLRVRYDQSDLSGIPGVEAHEKVLTGKAWLWDDVGAFLPKEIFHDFSGENLLYRALRRSGVLFFSWDKRRSGGNATQRTILIDHLRNVPDAKLKSLARTSGGAAVLPVPDGYIFSDNPEKSKDGAFTAHIALEEDVAFPIKPIDIGMGVPTKPMLIGLYVQLSLNGISFEHEARNRG